MKIQLQKEEIKTTYLKPCTALKWHFNCTIQELKLSEHLKKREMKKYFNCTIQELKQKIKMKRLIFFLHFNCTIQELKLAILRVDYLRAFKFQLHHTGIKTFYSLQPVTDGEAISIAPYRN